MNSPHFLGRNLRESFGSLSVKEEALSKDTSYKRTVVTFQYYSLNPMCEELRRNIKIKYATSPKEGIDYERKACLSLVWPFGYPSRMFKSLLGVQTKLAFEEVDDPYLLVVKGTFLDDKGNVATPKDKQVRALQFHNQWKGRV